MSKEYPCVYHKDGLCERFAEPGYVSYCVFGPCTEETPSNADRIRAMSDEELAAFLLNFFVEHMDINSIPHEAITAADEVELLRQLQQPAEGEKDGKK